MQGDSKGLYGLQKLFVSVSLKICGVKRIRATVSNCKKGSTVQHHKRTLWGMDDCRHAFLDCPASNPQATGKASNKDTGAPASGKPSKKS